MTVGLGLSSPETIIIQAMKRLPRFCYTMEIVDKVGELRGRKMMPAVALAALSRMDKNGFVSRFESVNGDPYESSYYLTDKGNEVKFEQNGEQEK